VQGRRADRTLPVLLEAVARELRAGASVQGALLVAATDPEPGGARPDPATGVLATALARGTPVGEAVGEWVGTRPTPARHLAGAALVVAAQTGGATAVVIDGVADTLRDRVALEREVAALSSQARASAVLLVVAPLVVAVVVASAEPRIAAFLFGSPVGWACILCGLVLDAVGAAWIHLTIRRSV
jgi:tight adherence protein B